MSFVEIFDDFEHGGLECEAGQPADQAGAFLAASIEKHQGRAQFAAAGIPSGDLSDEFAAAVVGDRYRRGRLRGVPNELRLLVRDGDHLGTESVKLLLVFREPRELHLAVEAVCFGINGDEQAMAGGLIGQGGEFVGGVCSARRRPNRL